MEGIHSAAHALCALLPVFVRSRRSDVNTQCKTATTGIRKPYR